MYTLLPIKSGHQKENATSREARNNKVEFQSMSTSITIGVVEDDLAQFAEAGIAFSIEAFSAPNYGQNPS